jgi:hypothetical protein
MSRTLNTQVALYLPPDKARELKETAERAGKTQQDLLREGVELMIRKYRLRDAGRGGRRS